MRWVSVMARLGVLFYWLLARRHCTAATDMTGHCGPWHIRSGLVEAQASSNASTNTLALALVLGDDVACQWMSPAPYSRTGIVTLRCEAWWWRDASM